MKERFLHLESKIEIILISSFLSSYIIYLLFIDYDFSLTTPSSLYISQATLDNVDISKRISLFYKIIGGLLLITPIVYLIFNKLKVKTKELSSLALISATGILLIICNTFGVTSTESIQLFTIVFFIKLTLLLLKQRFGTIRLINHDKFFGLILALSFVIVCAIIFIFNTPFIINNILWIFILVVIFLFFFIVLIKQNTHFLTRNIFPFFIPFAFVPLFIFLATEIHLFAHIKYNILLSYKWLFIGFIGITFLIFFVWNIVLCQDKLPTKPLINYIVPAALFSYLLLTIYHPIINQSLELFELANPAISQMKLFFFKEIPFVDFMSSHMFSEQFYGIIYNCIYGYRNSLSFLSYEFFYDILFYLITYVFLTRLFKNQFLSLLFLISFPFVADLFSIDLFFSIIIFFSIQRVLLNQNIKNYFFLLILLVLACFWRLDLGVSSLLTSLLFFPLIIFVDKKKIVFPILLKTIGVFAICLLVIVCFLMIIRTPEYILASIKTTLHYISAGQAHGYSIITNNFNQQFFIFHYLLPLFSLVFIFIGVYNLKTKETSLTTFQRFSLSASLFLFIIFLSNMQRGLVRHNFMENTDSFLSSTFYIATALFIVSFIKTNHINKLYISFLGLSFCLIIFIKYFPIDKNKTKLETLLTNSSLSNLSHVLDTPNLTEKVISDPEFERKTYLDFKSFLNANLLPHQTFLDFSNTPMLYYYCNRRVPSFFCQNLQNTVDEFLQLDQLKRINPSTTPVIIYSNYSPNWWDNTDGVPNSMRQSLIAEYIYKNYSPYGIINNRSIWISKGLNFKWDVHQVDTIVNTPQTYHYKYAASTISNYIHNYQKENYIQLGEGLLISIEKPDFSCYEISPKKETINGLYLRLIFNSIFDKKEIKVDLFGDNGLIGTIKFNQKENENNYMFPISNHYLMYKNKLKYIQLTNQDAQGLTKVAFYEKNSK
ncbi:MAG: hypothetical protein A3K10_12155 [Bacteroidetes bacterium RIFCSPLOWO2_12_FULL_31_6]|nr:MAG: hypothetical protein A3K10_12155 [Bacteroidetes bacterium RIFCSPLOWO2_12_FULL_31_6]